MNGDEGGGSYADILVGGPYYITGSPFGVELGMAYLYLGGNTDEGICDDDLDCDDFDACTDPDTCTDGICGGPAVDCDDDNPCTADSCNPATGCVNTPVDPAAFCDDSNPCTDDRCDPGIEFGCYHVIDYSNSCSDNNGCSTDDHCEADAQCHGTTTCDDGNDCTDDACVSGSCQNTNDNSNECSDGDACTGPDECSSGTCLAGDPVACDDSDPATFYSCSPSVGCTHTVQGAPAGVLESFSFLYLADPPLQEGVDPEDMVEGRLAVVRGQVFSEGAQQVLVPLGGVEVSILGHPEFGHTHTRPDGWYDMVVNGGGSLTVKLTKTGLLPAQRAVPTPWQGYSNVPDVVMIPLSSAVSAILLDEDMTEVQVARGAVEIDDDGTRQGTILFMPGTTATMTVGGQQEPLENLNVRITEYTVGPNGPQRMPAELPPTSGYTYAAELSVDEALAEEATRVDFSSPVVFYLENFLHIDVGVQVPVGIYDHTQGKWVPDHDGRVIKILSEADGKAVVDTDGDDDFDVNDFQLSAEELAALAELYAPDDELWRVSLTHFTTIDCNMGPGCPTDEQTGESTCVNPDSDGPENEDPPENPDCVDGSVIECQNGIVGERIPIVGTPYSLVHWSDRQLGWKPQRKIRIQVTDSDPPAAMTGGYVTFHVAGQVHTEGFYNIADQVVEWEWDGRDAYGRPVLGSQRVFIDLAYAFPGEWNAPAPGGDYSFAVQGAGISGGLGRLVIYMHQYFQKTLTSWDESARGLGGWTLDVNHVLDRTSQTVRLGDGSRKSASLLSPIATAFAGNGNAGPSSVDVSALSTGLSIPWDVEAGPGGDVYVSEMGNNVVRSVGADGYLRHFAGGGTIDCEAPQDDTPASSAGLSAPFGLDSGPNGEVFIAEWGCSRVRMVDASGKIFTVAGNGNIGTDPGEGALATNTQVYQPTDVAVGPDGSFYVTEPSKGRIRRVGTDGRIWTVVGCKTGDAYCEAYGSLEFGGVATSGDINGLYWIALGPDGSVFFNHLIGTEHLISRVGPDGILYRVAGGGNLSGYTADGHPAVEASLGSPTYGHSMTVGRDGTLYFGDQSAFRYVDVNGRIGTLSLACAQTNYPNCDSSYPNGDGGPVGLASLLGSLGMDVGPDGKVYVAVRVDGNGRVRAIHSSSPSGFATGVVKVPSRDGRELWVFDSRNLHLRTEDAVTGQSLLEFDYDAGNRLIGIRDIQAGETELRRTEIHYNVNGVPTQIVGPDGQATTLTVADGYLTGVQSPKTDESYTISYYSGPTGLIHEFTNPRGLTAHLTYATDGSGRLREDEDSGDGSDAGVF
ncbi:MAG: hypothetical protein MUD05_07470, partial [Candidatus Nanopelagicales bacterium]|nr:hypothetical protein [Candidatus Nanopelagicales bacterium]